MPSGARGEGGRGAHPRAAVYRATRYEVDDGGVRLALRIDAPCAALDALLVARGVEEWAYLTAWNPGGRPAPAAANAEAQARLEAEVTASGRPFLRGASVADAGDWPPEPSLLVLGLPRAEALALAARYGQEAIVAGRRGGAASLLFRTP